MHCEYIEQIDFDGRSVIKCFFFYSKKAKTRTLLDPSGAQKGLWHLLKVIRDIKRLIHRTFLAHTQTLSKKVKQAKEEMDFFLFLLSSKTSW